MRPPAAPRTTAIAAISPSGYDVMRACRLRTSFAQVGRGSPHIQTAPQLLGIICHSVLEWLTETRAILDERWEDQLDLRWEHATAEASAELAASGQPNGPPEDWEGYSIKLARLRKAARRLHRLLAPLGEQAELITETPLSAADDRIRGRPDLIVRSPDGHWLLDYKTGPVISRDSREPRDSYVRQLRLYAYLQAETIGEWPDRAFLVPLQGPLVEVEIDPAACRELAADALELLDAYNARVPDPQPPSPAPETCRWCPYAPHCPAFWESCDESWGPVVRAAAGVATGVAHPSLGGISVSVAAEAGSVDRGPLKVRAISSEQHGSVAALRDGDHLALVGLRHETDGDAFVLPDSGRAAIWPQ